MRIFQALLSVLLVIAVLGSLPVLAQPDSAGDTASPSPAVDVTAPPSALYETVGETDAYLLFADPVNGNFVLRDRASRADWYSCPPTIKEDKTTKGVAKTNLRSMLVVSYVEAATLASSPVELTVNSYVGAVLNETLTVEKLDNGFSVLYTFADEGFSIPVEVLLKDDGLHIRVPVSGIKNESGNLLTRIDLLPGFMAAGKDETEGALFVPSGSGALIRFDSHKGGYGTYSERIYGEDAAINLTEANRPTQGIQVPVYGILRKDTALAAVILSGDATAAIYADGIGPTMGYNRVYSQYQLAVLDSTKLFEADYFNQREIFSAESRKNLEDYEVCFTPLSGEKGNLGGIAEAYRNQLIKQGLKAQPASPTLGVTLYGAATRKASFLGIPYEKTFAMTTFNQAAQIVDDLNQNGVPVALRYEGWTNAGLQNKKIPVSAAPVRVLGGKKGYKNLISALTAQNTATYFDVDFRSIRRSGRGFSVLSDVIKTMFNTRSEQYRFMLSTGVPTLVQAPWYRIRSTEIPGAATRFAASFRSASGISLNGFGEDLYSDFNRKNSLSRADCLQAYAQAATAFGETPLAVTRGNAYTYLYADRIFALPQSHNGHLLFDESVPFLQMVLHGYIPYTSQAINRDAQPELALLDCIAYGSDPYYIGIAENAGTLIETNFSYLYSTTYSSWSQKAIEAYRQYKAVHADLYDSPIVGYTFPADGVSETVFADGTRVLVNRTDAAVTVAGTTVEGLSYTVIR